MLRSALLVLVGVVGIVLCTLIVGSVVDHISDSPPGYNSDVPVGWNLGVAQCAAPDRDFTGCSVNTGEILFAPKKFILWPEWLKGVNDSAQLVFIQRVPSGAVDVTYIYKP